MVTTDTSEENVTIEIKESNGNSTISISPADVSYDTSYSVVEAVNEVTSGSYDSNEPTTIPPVPMLSSITISKMSRRRILW